ncbi:MAG: ferrochelatase [Coriobacteriia bacterium]|nr:ferrochelatase [Coriobacteriia bacterium]
MDAVIIVGYGAPETLEEVSGFMTSLIGRTPSDEVLDRLKSHYVAIGGRSPLIGYAREIAASVEKKLASGGTLVPVEIGMVHTAPSIIEAVDALVDCGATRIIAVSLSPFYSTASNGRAFEEVGGAVALHEGVKLVCAPEIGLFEGFIKAQADALGKIFDAVDVETDEAPISFSAHSLPLSAVETGDYVYEDGLRRAADALSEHLFLSPADEDGYMIEDIKAYGTSKPPRPWCVTFQSQGMRGADWLKPTLSEFIDDAAKRGIKAVVCSPLGFSTDHMETLYDLDIVAKKQVTDAGMAFFRSASPNNSESLVDAFVESIETVRESE